MNPSNPIDPASPDPSPPGGDAPPPGETSGRDPAAQLPAGFVVTLMAALFGALFPGVLMTLVAAPGNRGSPVFGLLLPWSALPFLLAVAAAWRCRFSDTARMLGLWTSLAAFLGIVTYAYGFFIHPGGNQNIVLFLWVPLWQCILLTHPTLKGFQAGGRATRPRGEDADATAGDVSKGNGGGDGVRGPASGRQPGED